MFDVDAAAAVLINEVSEFLATGRVDRGSVPVWPTDPPRRDTPKNGLPQRFPWGRREP